MCIKVSLPIWDAMAAAHFVVPSGTKHISPQSWVEWKVDPLTIKEVTISEEVETILHKAFYDCASLVKITIPGSVRSIGTFAFSDCYALVDVQISNGVKSIKGCAFARCTALVEIKLPTSVEVIEDNAFMMCYALETVELPPSVKRMGDECFWGCTALKHVTISLASMESIGTGVFAAYCNPPRITLNLGTVADIDTPNRFPTINGLVRTATLVHQLPGKAGSCIVWRVWPASTVELPLPNQHMVSPCYAATEPNPATLVNGSGIVAPLQLQTLAGDEYPVHGCWGKDPVAHPNFTRLAAEQHPKALGEPGSWDVLLHNTDVSTHTLDLAAVGDMIARDELDLEEPVLVIWTKLEDTEEVESSVALPSDESSGSKRGNKKVFVTESDRDAKIPFVVPSVVHDVCC